MSRALRCSLPFFALLLGVVSFCRTTNEGNVWGLVAILSMVIAFPVSLIIAASAAEEK